MIRKQTQNKIVISAVVVPMNWDCTMDYQDRQEKKVRPDTIPLSQAGTGRHKDAMAAYYWGYEEGVRRAT